MVFHWSFSDSKFSPISRILLIILVDFNNAVIWMVSTCLFISKSSRSFNNSLGIVPSAPTTIGITVVLCSTFFSALRRSTYLSLFSFSFPFTQWSVRKTISTTRLILLFLLTITRFGHLTEIRRSICISKSQRTNHSPGRILGSAYITCSYRQIIIIF